MWPEPYATIVREREKGTPPGEVAKMFDVHPNTVRGWVREWNRSNPENPIPRQRKVSTSVYVKAAELKQQGLSRAEVARQLGLPEWRVTNLWSHARARGLLPRIVPKAEQGGKATYEAFYGKGAAPRMGSLKDLLNDLSAKEVNQLVALVDARNDATLAQTITRILKEHLRDNPKG